MNERITDEILLLIQNHHELMNDYLRAIEKDGLDKVNTTIGKAVKEAYDLEYRSENREREPRSTLIKSHQIILPSYPRKS